MTTRNPTQQPAPNYGGPKLAFDGQVRPLDRADLRANARQAYQIGDVFYRISDVAQSKLTDNAVVEAQREGARLGGLNTKKITVMRGGKPTEVDIPTLTKAEGSGAVARAWNQAAESAYAMRLDTATMQHITAAAAENPADPEGMRQSLKGWHEGIKDLIPPEYAAKYEHDLYTMAQPLITRAETQQMQNIAHDQAVDAKVAADTLVGTMVVNSSLGADGAAVSAAQFKNYVDATQARIGPFFSEADARLEIHQVLSEAAHGAIQAAFEGAPNKRAMMQAFESGKPVISLPAVGEDGEVTAGMYDKNTLIQLVGAEKVQAQVNGLAGDIKMQDAEARARAAEAKAAENERLYGLQTDVQLSFPDAEAELQATGSTKVLTPSDIYAAYPREKDRRTAEKLVAKLNLAAQSGSVRKVIAGNSPEQDAAYLESLKPKAGTPDFAEAAALYNLAAAEHDAKVTALKTDPASYVMQTNETVQQAWQDATDNDPAKIKAAVAATKQAQIALGVPEDKAQVMPAEHAAGLASVISTASPDTVAGTIDGISQAYGADGLNQVIGAGVPPMAKAVAFADAPEYGAWRSKAIQAMQVKESVLRDQSKARGIDPSEIDTALEGVTADLQATMPAAAAAPYVDAVRQVALFNAANNGMDKDSAVADAWSVFASAYSFNGSYRVPKKWDGEKVSGALTNVISNLDKMDIRPAIIGAGGVDPAFAKSETIDALKRGHYRWVTDENETGVYLTYEEGPAVKLGDGSKVHFTFDQLMILPKSEGDMIDQLRGLSGTN